MTILVIIMFWVVAFFLYIWAGSDYELTFPIIRKNWDLESALPRSIFIDVCRELRFPYKISGKWVKTVRAGGIYRGHRIEFYYEQLATDKVFTVLKIHNPTPLPYQLSLGKEDFKSTMLKAVGRDDIRTGDDWFDEKMLIHGTSDLIIGFFDYKTRKLIRAILAHDEYEIHLNAEYFELKIPGLIRNTTHFIRILKLLLNLSSELQRPPKVKERVVENILQDKMAAVRKRNIEALVAHGPMNDDIRQTLRKAVLDTEPVVKLTAAFYLGPEGYPHLGNMLQESPEPYQSQALHILIQKDDPATIPYIRLALANIKLAATAALVLGDFKDTGSINLLIKVFHKSTSNSIKLAAVKALGAIGSAEASDFLLEQRAHPDFEIQLQVLQALGNCGEIQVVETLINYMNSVTQTRVKSAAKEAIALIQSRLGPAEKGWLTIAEQHAAEGALSVSSPEPEGTLSINEPTDAEVDEPPCSEDG
ncbi:HEAT repeat domain-containing protein [candidate division CSSED10-310 bacterium]|uniref:HEAT repeat domain-containing protein n=1 Tax=candidate division CSSED10-310 bacterium TaxID=2855610 RepID=A0ABV6YRK4_UNCC1